MNWRERIVVDLAILVGKPVIRGTRIAVELIIDLLARGYSKEQILEADLPYSRYRGTPSRSSSFTFRSSTR